MEANNTLEEFSRRFQRIEALLARLSHDLGVLIQSRQQVVQDVLFSQSAYLGDHRALTYLRSGQKIFVDTRCIDVGSHLLLGGVWEPNYATAFARLLKPGQIVLDIGANHGFYALLAAGQVAPGGHIYAFEPNPRLNSLIKDSIAVNGLGSLITLVEKAVTDREGEMSLVFQDRHSAWGHLQAGSPQAGTPSEQSDLTCSVEGVVLDRYFPDLRVDVVKMDIEGAEGGALTGMAGLIERSPEMKIMMEFSPRLMSRFNQNAEDVADFLLSRGFACWLISADGSLMPAQWPSLLAEREAIQNIIVSRQAVA
jgi:FkbM family methyltransferase